MRILEKSENFVICGKGGEMSGWFFNKSGKACLFLHEDRFVSKYGYALGWLVNEDVYSLAGKHIGWFENGVLYDGCNRVLAFQEDAVLYLPFIPTIVKVPYAPIIPYPQERPELSGAPYRPSYCEGWSESGVLRFFLENNKVVTL
jgi:hypothetical protein